MGDSQVNRRQHTRASVKASVLLTYGERSGGGVATDVSEGGMRLVTPASIELGASVRLMFDLGGKPVQALATIVHGDSYRGYGLKFVLVRREGMQIIRRLVAGGSGTEPTP